MPQPTLLGVGHWAACDGLEGVRAHVTMLPGPLDLSTIMLIQGRTNMDQIWIRSPCRNLEYPDDIRVKGTWSQDPRSSHAGQILLVPFGYYNYSAHYNQNGQRTTCYMACTITIRAGSSAWPSRCLQPSAFIAQAHGPTARRSPPLWPSNPPSSLRVAARH